MHTERFQYVVKRTFDWCSGTLFAKAREYARDDDRLHNFKKVAHLNDTTPPRALGDLMGKHIVSIYDMIENPTAHRPALWDEKIGDAINYLLLLRAMVDEMQELEQFNIDVEQKKHIEYQSSFVRTPDLAEAVRKGMEAGYIPREGDELEALRAKLLDRTVTIIEEDGGMSPHPTIEPVEEDADEPA